MKAQKRILIYVLAAMTMIALPFSSFSKSNQAFAAGALSGDPNNPNGLTDAELQALPDYTHKLVLRPDLTLLFPVRKSCDQHCQPLPDHNMVMAMEAPSEAAYSFKWTFTDPLNAQGVRAVDRADVRDSHKVSFFYANQQNCTLTGFTNVVRISDELFRQLKLGQAPEFTTDGPYAQMVNHAESVPLPRSLRAVGTATLPVLVDENKVKVQTIEAQANNGWTYWILDNPRFPIILRGTGPFEWQPPIFSYANGLPGESSGSGTKEGRRIVKDLQDKGVATTYAINFDFDSAKLRPASKPVLNEVAKYLKANPTIHLQVQGHTCTIGTYPYNMTLSDRRAKSVRDYLVQAGVESSRLQPIGYGFTKPIASNKTNAGREKNRRVVFQVLK